MRTTLGRAGILVAIMVVVGLLGAGYTVRAGNSGLTSSAELVVTGNSSSAQDNAYTSSQYVTNRMSTYAAVATSEAVIRPAASSLGVDAGDLAGAVTATVVPNTTVLELTVRGSTSTEAQRRAMAVTAALSRAIVDLETGATGPSAVAVKVLNSASAPSPSSLPSPLVAGLIGLGVGLVLGFLLLVVVGRRRSQFRARASFFPSAREVPEPDTGHAPATAASGPVAAEPSAALDVLLVVVGRRRPQFRARASFFPSAREVPVSDTGHTFARAANGPFAADPSAVVDVSSAADAEADDRNAGGSAACGDPPDNSGKGVDRSSVVPNPTDGPPRGG